MSGLDGLRRLVRVGDICVGICDHGQKCCPHGCVGVAVTGSTDVKNNGRYAHRDADFVAHNCPHCGGGLTIATSRHKVNGRKRARIGDINIGMGADVKIFITASPDTEST